MEYFHRMFGRYDSPANQEVVKRCTLFSLHNEEYVGIDCSKLESRKLPRGTT